MSDPFEKARKIRKGELDDHIPDFEEITGWIQRVPMSWLPEILRRVVVASIDKKVFVEPNGLRDFVEIAKRKHNSPGHGILRSDGEKA